MAGFFGFFDYTKPGPGVPKDAPPKSPFIVFFEVLQRKFWNFVKANIMFDIFNIPAIILGMLVMLFFFPNIIPDAMNDPDALISDTVFKFVLLSLMMNIPMVTVGPAQAGFTYIMRNYSREEHAFLWGDFKETAQKNMKQSLIVSIINFFITFLMLWSIRAYIIMGSGNILMTVGAAFMIMMFVVFAAMNMYIYPIMITFNLTIKQIYKNALIFAVIKFFPNVGILLLTALIEFLFFGMIIPFNPVIGFIFYLFITVSLTGFLTNFYAYPKLKKYMMSHLEEDEEEEDDDEEDEDDNEEDDGAEEESSDESGDGYEEAAEVNDDADGQEDEADDNALPGPDSDNSDNSGGSGNIAGSGANNETENSAENGSATKDDGAAENDTGGEHGANENDRNDAGGTDDDGETGGTVGDDGVRRFF